VIAGEVVEVVEEVVMLEEVIDVLEAIDALDEGAEELVPDMDADVIVALLDLVVGAMYVALEGLFDATFPFGL
jgi:hypothetical protein